jgi:hypothetical protein
VRYAARVDASQDAIVSALRAAGASVVLIKWPTDALVGYCGQTLIMEFKTPGTAYGKKPNKNQREFMATWKGGPVSMVDGPEAALRALGVLKQKEAA